MSEQFATLPLGTLFVPIQQAAIDGMAPASIVGALALAGANASPGAAPGRALFCQPSRGQRGGSIGAACGALAPLGGAPGKAQGGLQRGTIAASDH